jgi:hypothetical protein
MSQQINLCGQNGCRLIEGHNGEHDEFPRVWESFFRKEDNNKINKAGYATPRGGSKGGYQNHVYRNGKVIIPYERLNNVNLNLYKDGYVIRLYPEHFFDIKHIPKIEFQDPDSIVKIGVNAFILYRNPESFARFPPPEDWEIRSLLKTTNDGTSIKANRRGKNIDDKGEYILRLPSKADEGVPQGIFAPEYAEENINYLCQCVLAWLTIHTLGSPYTSKQAEHLKAILTQENIGDGIFYEYKGIMSHSLTKCPLCARFIRYKELHETVSFLEESGLENAAEQVKDTTRSTIVNLFHMMPLIYNELRHTPENMAWGHAICNTRLGQRKCYSLRELIDNELKVGIIYPEGIETFGWISNDFQMIRSPNGAVWIQLHGDIAENIPPNIAENIPPSITELIPPNIY